MSKKKRVLLCLCAIVAVTLFSVLIVISFDLTDMVMLFLVLSAIAVVGLFIAITVYGVKSGLMRFGGILYLIAIIVFLELEGIWLWLGVIGLALMFIAPWLWNRWQAKQAEINSQSYELAQVEAGKIERAVLNGVVYLTRSSRWNPGPTYKVVMRGDTLYFCRVGGGIGEIDFDIATNENLAEQELLSHKKSFSLPTRDITRVEISTKLSMLTGNIPNNGTVSIHVGEQKHNLIVHPINDYEMVEAFFKSVTHAPVTVEIDKHTKALQLEEQALKSYAEHSPEKLEKLRVLKRLCRTLNIAGWVYGCWALIVMYPQMPLTIIGLLLPSFAFALYFRNRDIITLSALSQNKQFKHLHLAGALMAPAIGLTVLALDYNVFHTVYLWVTVVVTTIVLTVMVLVLSDEHKRNKWLRVYTPIMIACFVYGAIITTNALFDQAPHPSPANHQFTQLERMRVSTGEWSDRFNFTLDVIDHEGNMDVQLTPDNFRISVRRRTYDVAVESDVVRLCVMPGLWGLPWVRCVAVLTQYRD